MGGTWYWNRYPGARYDSESYTYGYLFSEELFAEWDWTEHFAGQPENERYFNHVVDKFDLRRHIRFNTKITSAVWDQSTATWLVKGDGYAARARYVVAATGVLSVPFYPAIPGRYSFRGEAYHTGLWPKTPVDFTGKRVAVIGTGSSGVQVIPMVAPEAAALTVYQRTPNWATPLNNRPITPQEQAALKADFETIRDTCNSSPSGFMHQHSDKLTFDDSPEERLGVLRAGLAARRVREDHLQLPGHDPEPGRQRRVVALRRRQDPRRGQRPGDGREADPDRPRLRGQAPPVRDRLLRGLQPPQRRTGRPERDADHGGHRDPAWRRRTACKEFDIIVWATGFDFGTGALNRLGVRGVDRLPLEEYWADGPLTYLGLMCHHFPNFFFPGGPHGAAGNNPRYSGDQSDFIAGLIDFARDHRHPVIEVPKALEDEWTTTVNEAAITMSPFNEKSYFFGTNIPGKPKAFLLNSLGRPKLLEMMEAAAKTDYAGFFPDPPVPPVET